jgi:hypothetical protein
MYNRAMAKKLKPKTLRHHLKHWLMPHKHNDHRPHLIRLHGLAVIAFMIIGIQVTANVVRPPSVRVLGYATDITPVNLLTLTNQQRTANGLAPLRLDARLNQSATLKASNMFSENYWAHVSPSGIQPWYWFQQAGYNYSYAGENLAKDFDTSAGTVDGWMNSPGHRANILNAYYTDVGFAVQNGTLVGGQTTLVVAHSGSISGRAVAAAPIAPTPKAVVPAPVIAASTPAPVITAAPTQASPSIVPTPAPTVVAHPVVPTGLITSSAPAPKRYSLFAPLSVTNTLNLGTIVTIALLLVLLIVYIYTHLTVWRKGLKRWRSSHYKLLAAGQVGGLAVAIIVLAVSGFGSVG